MSLLTALPSLIGALIGVCAYLHGGVWEYLALALVLAPYPVMRYGRRMLATSPRFGAALIEFWVLASIGVTALATTFLIHVGVGSLPAFLGDATKLSADAQKVVFGTFFGAVATYVSVVWTKDIADGNGGAFSPVAQFKKGMAAAYEALKSEGRQPGDSATYDAIFLDSVQSTKIKGWGFLARKGRADVLARYLANLPAKS